MDSTFHPLSEKEARIALRYAEGATYKVIAAELHLSPSTVRNHLANIYRKLGVNEKAGLIRALAEHSEEDSATTGTRGILGEFDRLELPDRPSIAVLPFANASDDPDNVHFSDGVTDGVIDGLTRFRDLFVMGRTSSFFFRDQAIESAELGRRLGVEYLVQGTVRRRADRVRINTELVSAATGQNLWSERFDRTLADVFAVEDEVSSAIVSMLAERVEIAAYKRTGDRLPVDLAAYDWVLRGNRMLEIGDLEALRNARTMYERALALQSDCASAYTGLSKAWLYEHWGGHADDPDEALRLSHQFGAEAVKLDDQDSRAHYALGHAYFCQGRHDLAELHVDKALALNPGEYHHLCFKGYLLACTGRYEESTSCLASSLRRNPLAPNSCLLALGLGDYLSGRYEDATVALGRLSGELQRKFSCLAASYAQLGRDEDATNAAEAFLDQLASSARARLGEDQEKWREHWLRMYCILTPGDIEHLLDGLRKSGFPA